MNGGNKEHSAGITGWDYRVSLDDFSPGFLKLHLQYSKENKNHQRKQEWTL